MLSPELADQTKPGAREAPEPALKPIDRTDHLPLSFAQQRLWFLDRLLGDPATYNIPTLWRLSGELDTEALRRSIQLLVERHEALRTRFILRGYAPIQAIGPAGDVALPITDLSAITPEKRETEVRRIAEIEVRQPFDLASGRLLRAQLLRIGPQEHLLLLNVHHIAFDGWSMTVLWRELSYAYAVFMSGQTPEMPELPVQYADYAVWQREWLQGDVLEGQLAYWKDQLADLPVLQLPSDRPGRPLTHPQGGLHAFDLGAPLTEALKALTRRQQATLFMTLLAAFQVLLFRYSGQHDFAVGSPIAGRRRTELEGLIGFFVNTLVLRSDLSGNPTFTELLVRVRESALGAFAHQDVPFERLVEEFSSSRDIGNTPLFQVMFVLRSAADAGPRLRGVRANSLPLPTPSAKFDLTLVVSETPAGLSASWEYSKDLFDLASIERMTQHFKSLLEGIATDADRPIGQLPLLTDAERHQLLAGWNDTARPIAPATLPALFIAQAQRTPDAAAVLFEDRTLTYAALDGLANRLAKHLQKLGVGPDALVGVCAERSPELVVGLVGALKAGGAYVPLDPGYPPARLTGIMTDAALTVVLTQRAIAPKLALPAGTHCVLLDDEASWSDDTGPSLLPDGMGALPPQHLAPQHLATMIYTSGSTGTPKGAANSHEGLHNRLAWAQSAFGLTADDVVLQKTPFSFDVSVWEFFWPLIVGAKLAVAAPRSHRDPRQLVATIRDHGVTVLHFVPSMLAAFVDHLTSEPEALQRCRSMRRVICSGEALSADLRDQVQRLLPWVQLENLYGPTEAAIDVTHWSCAADTSRQVPIGRPIWNTRTYVLDAALEPVPAGVAGELYLAGIGLARGYLNRAGLTSERFVADAHGPAGARMYRTGDLARWRSDGVIEFLGRADAQLKLRGYRIEPGEIEALLQQQASVSAAAVVARTDREGGHDQRLVAYVVPHIRTKLDVSELRSALAAALPDYMVPSAFVAIEQLPLNPNGKLDRSALPAPAHSDSPGATSSPPRDELERALAEIFSDVLDTAITSRDADFFRLGGHSLLVLRVVVECQKRLALSVSVQTVYSHPSIAALADCLRRSSADNRGTDVIAGAMARVPRDGAHALTPQQYALWLELKLQSDEGVYNVPIAFRVGRQLPPERVRLALARLAMMHEVLRARLIEQEDEPQFVVDRSPEDLELQVLDGNPANLQEAVLCPFDLARGPLWRAALHHDAQDTTVLLLVVHHLVFDASSREILLRDLAAAFNEPTAALPAADTDFFDLAKYECERLAAERLALDKFWAETLADAELTPNLPPPCMACPPGAEETGGAARHNLPATLAQQVKTRAAELGTTPFQVYLAGFLTLLRTYTAGDDLVIGTPSTLRDTPPAQNVVGYLLSPVALRMRLAGQQSFRDLVAEVKRRWQEVREHARLPMHLVLQAALGGRRTGLGSPVQVFFSLVRDAEPVPRIDGMPMIPVDVPAHPGKFPLFLLVEEQSETASFMLTFQRRTLDPDMAGRLLEQLERLLRAATADIDQPLSKLAFLEPNDRRQLRTWGTNERPYPRNSSIPDLFEDVVRRHRQATAIIAGDAELSYATLDRRANAVADILHRAGVGRGDRVPLLLPRGPRFIACALGVLKCGAAFVPIEPGSAPTRVAKMIEGLGARVGLRASGLTPGAIDIACGISWLDAACADQETASAPPMRQYGADDAAYVMFTSGSTGSPKGVEVPHRAIVRLVHSQDFARMGSSETWLHMAPTSFDASTLEIWAALLHGGRCVVLEDSLPAPRLIAAAIRRHGVTSAWFTAALFNTLVDESLDTFTGLRQILIGGEVLSPRHVRRAFERFPDARFVNGYGPTENTTFTCCHVITRDDLKTGGPIPIGLPIANTSVFVVDKDGRLVPPGVPGELVAGGDGIALCYVGQPERTAERFLPDTLSETGNGRLYRTGDRVRWRPDGVLEFLGRMDDQIKIRGNRVEPGEIVACLCEHPGVRQIAVVSRQANSGVLQLVAYVVPEDTALKTELAGSLRSHAVQRLPTTMVPAEFILVASLPRQPNGKLDVDALSGMQTHAAQTLAAEVAKPVDLTSIEAKLLEIWREILHQPALDADDDFFMAGGDSLLALAMIARTERELRIGITVRSLIEGRTIRGVALLLAERRSALLPQGVVCVRDGAHDHPLFYLPSIGASALEGRTLAAKLHTQRAVYTVEHTDLDPAVLKSLAAAAAATAMRIRGVQPKGPYSILGYSFGGNLAVEVARVLTAEGERVDPVIVLDAFAPDSMLTLTRFRQFLRYVRSGLRARWSKARHYHAPRIVHRLKPAFIKPPSGIELDGELKFQTLVALGTRAVYFSDFNPFDQRIVLVKATLRGPRNWFPKSESNDTNGWAAICMGGVGLITIDCTHAQMLLEPKISELAIKLEQALESANASRSQ